MIAGLLAVALSALAATPVVAPLGTPPAADDPLPAALDALLLMPEDLIFFGVPDLADGQIVASALTQGRGRSIVAVGDINGDGWSEFAVGDGPGSLNRSLSVRDGKTAALRWQASPDGGNFRTLNGLAARGPWLAAGACSPRGRVECRASATGARRWSIDLAPRGAPAPANILGVLWVPDLNGDGEDDLVVAGGRSIDAVVALSGSNGRVLWTRATSGCAAALAEAGDLDHDGRPDVFVVGGAATPYAAALSGADGRPLWTVPLPAPGSAVVRLDDADRDGIADLAVGLFAQPGACLLGLSGDDGALLWSNPGVPHDVTALDTLSDLDADGVRDLAIGSFHNTVSAVSARLGEGLWSHEGSTNNTGAMLDVAAVGDLDGNGSIDVVSASVDHQIYVYDGQKGHPLAIQDLRARGIGVAALPDGSGDGRQEFVAAGDGKLLVLGGGSGTVLGPVITFKLPQTLAGVTTVKVYACPQTTLIVMGSLGTGELELPGFTGSLDLDLSTLTLLHTGMAPAAGESGYPVAPFPPAFAGATIYWQAATLFEPGFGLIGPLAPQTLPVH